jgi:hypothetical protein
VRFNQGYEGAEHLVSSITIKPTTDKCNTQVKQSNLFSEVQGSGTLLSQECVSATGFFEA